MSNENKLEDHIHYKLDQHDNEIAKSYKVNLIDSIRNFNDQLSKNINEIKKTADDLQDIRDLDRTVPDALLRELNRITPDIAGSVLEQMAQNYEKDIGHRLNKLIDESTVKVDSYGKHVSAVYDNIDQRMQTTYDNQRKLDGSKFKMFWYNLACTILVSTLCAAGGTYFLLTKFPQEVTVYVRSGAGPVSVTNSKIYAESGVIVHNNKGNKIEHIETYKHKK